MVADTIKLSKYAMSQTVPRRGVISDIEWRYIDEGCSGTSRGLPVPVPHMTVGALCPVTDDNATATAH